MMRYSIKRDGKLIHSGLSSFNDALYKLQAIQGMSYDWAVKYEGWSIDEEGEENGER